MGRILSPYDVVGGLTKAAAEACGLRAGTPITAGCGDSAASSLGAGITEPGILYDVAGTASIFSACTDLFAPDTENRTVLYAHSVIRDLWIPLAYISGGGLCLRWFRDTFLGASAPSGYGLLEQEAAGVEPAAPDYILYRTLQAEPVPTIRRCGEPGWDWNGIIPGRICIAPLWNPLHTNTAYIIKSYRIKPAGEPLWSTASAAAPKARCSIRSRRTSLERIMYRCGAEIRGLPAAR